MATNSTRQFEWNGHTITTKRPRNRDRENMRKLSRVIRDLDYSDTTKSEFVTAVGYTLSGDEDIWKRPSVEASQSVIVAALEQWLDDVDPDYTDALLLNVYGSDDPVTSPKAAEDSDPNSAAPEANGSNLK